MEAELHVSDDRGRRSGNAEALPVLVLGADGVTGLGIARALHGQGVPIVGLAVDPSAPACRSTVWREVRAVATNSPQAWLEAAATAARTWGRMVPIPASDEAVATLAEHADSLRDRFELVISPPDVVSTLLDKGAFHVWAEREGFPVPRTAVVADEEELADALAGLRHPVVLKPFERTVAWQAASPRHKVVRLESARDLQDIPFALFDVADRYVLQEWIPGTDSDVHFCLVYRDRDGKELGHQTGRKLLQWPPGTGNTVACVTDEYEELHDLTRSLFDAAGMVGLGSLEAKRSAADGRLYITEPTVGRPDLQSGLSTAAGTNLTLLAYRDACELPIGPSRPGVRATWVHESTLPMALATAIPRGGLNLRLAAAMCRGGFSRGTAFAARGDTRPLRAALGRQVAKLAARITGGSGRRRQRGAAAS